MAAGLDNLRHVVVLMMENRSFDHMLGALMQKFPKINGLTGKESNPDTTGAIVRVQPNAQLQSQLDPDPDHHFPGVDLQIFGGQQGDGRVANMQGFVKDYFTQTNNIGRSHNIMYYFTPDKLPVLTTLATRVRRFQRLVFFHPRADDLQSCLRSLRNLLRPGGHGYFLYLGQDDREHL